MLALVKGVPHITADVHVWQSCVFAGDGPLAPPPAGLPERSPQQGPVRVDSACTELLGHV